MKDIIDFRIGVANYTLINSKGTRLKLTLNYAKNTHKAIIVKDSGNVGLITKQAKVVAKHLLGKKAKRNLAYKLVHLKQPR